MKTIILKLSGELLLDKALTTTVVKAIKDIPHKLGIVIGGGNFFRGDTQGVELGLRASTAHEVGMLATVMNGIILKDLLEKSGMPCTLLSAIPCHLKPVTQEAIDNSEGCIIFVGGSGNPFFTTDTAAVLRALQIGATEVWKATNVDGVYDRDPNENPDATIVKTISPKKAVEQKLKVMDLTAMTLAMEHDLKVRVFNMNALDKVHKNESIGSVLSKNDVNIEETRRSTT